MDETILGRDAILTASDLPTEKVSVPEWGGTVLIRTMTAEERDRFEVTTFEEKQDKTKKVNVRARLASLVIVDANGNRLFSELDALLLAKKSGKAMDRVFEAASRLNGLSKDDIADLEKNSAAAPNGG